MPKRSGFGTVALGSELRTAWSRDSLTTHPSQRPQCGSSIKTLPNAYRRVNDVVSSLCNFYPPAKLALIDFAIDVARILREKRCEVVGQGREEFEMLARSRMCNRKR